MKSNQDRSNECLPPKKRELQSSSLANEERPLAMAPATDTQRTENLAWLASVAGGHRGVVSGGGVESDGPQYKPLSSLSNSTSSYSSSSYSSCSSSASSNLRLVSSLPAVYTSPLSQSAVGGTIHYTQLPPNLQFIASPYPTPYAGYISSQLLPPPPPPPPLSSSSPSSSSSSSLQRSLHMETAFVSSSSASSLSCLSSVSSQASKYDQQRVSSAAARTSMPPPLTDAAHHHYVQVASAAPRTALSPHHQGSTHLPLHPHHMLGHGASQVVVQYADGPTRKEEGGHRPRELHNGELERGRRFESGLGKPGNKSRDMSSSASSSLCGYDGRQLVMSSDYTTHDPSGMRTSLMLMPNSHGDHHLAPRASPDKLPASTHPEKGGIVLGKPVNRTPSTSSFVFPPPLSVDSLKTAVSTLSPHTVIQTTQNATESMSLGLHSPSIYPQPPIIGYIAGGNGQQQPLSYHAGLSQHLLIPGAQPVIIPVSGGGVSSLDAPHVTSSAQALSFPTALPHTYIAAAAPKAEPLESSPGGLYHQAQLHLPVIPAPPSAAPPPPAASAASGQSAPPSLPPYFIKGSIIQLADGELKHVEDLKTEDFIQSAEISSELKIDSSTVERIDGSHASPNFALVQFSVGEHRAQVSVEVLVEYPFFVFGQGWSSCCPDRTTQLLELPCTKLSVGDVCISLTLKNLRNGSLKKTQSLELATPAVQASYISHGYLKPPRAVPEPPRRHGERENGLGQRGIAGNGGGAENGDLRCAERGLASKGLAAGNSEVAATASKPTGRKRRWSAPEGRKVEKTEEEPPMTLPKPSFIPHELKVSIEGRSNIGK